MMEKIGSIIVREGTKDDWTVIYATWLRSYKRGSEFAQLIPWNGFFDGHHEVVETILSRPTTKILVAFEEGLPEVVQGYIVWEVGIADRDVLHYVYTKELYQRCGVATKLITTSGIDRNRVYYTHHTRDRIDADRKSPLYGTLRYRGAETLLRKWPAQKYKLEVVNGVKMWRKIEGNVYYPYLWTGRMPKRHGDRELDYGGAGT